jgi:SAM-dependent methyltransferase
MALERFSPTSTPEHWRLYGHQHLQRYQFAGAHVAGKRVLDLACGVGYGSYALRTLGAREVVGVDLSAEAIAYARANYLRSGLSYEAADAMTWTPAAGGFDVVTSFETIEHLPDPRGFLERVAGHLASRGLLLVSAPNSLRYQKATPPRANEFHLNEPDYRTLVEWLEPWFEIEGEWEQSPVVDGQAGAALRHVGELNQLLTYRVIRKIETILRNLFLRPAAPLDPLLQPQEVITDIQPLLPERRHAADVFLFVCRRKS